MYFLWWLAPRVLRACAVASALVWVAGLPDGFPNPWAMGALFLSSLLSAALESAWLRADPALVLPCGGEVPLRKLRAEAAEPESGVRCSKGCAHEKPELERAAVEAAAERESSKRWADLAKRAACFSLGAVIMGQMGTGPVGQVALGIACERLIMMDSRRRRAAKGPGQAS